MKLARYQRMTARKAADAAIGAAKAALVEMDRKHGRTVHLIHPAYTTMDCATCGARNKHALLLSERTCTRTGCGAVSPRDKNSARVVKVPGRCRRRASRILRGCRRSVSGRSA